MLNFENVIWLIGVFLQTFEVWNPGPQMSKYTGELKVNHPSTKKDQFNLVTAALIINAL